jgi:formyltetrahydrofolate deformylase
MTVIIQCKDKVGLVATIAGALAEEQLNIISLREHVDTHDYRSFLRVEVDREVPKTMLESRLQSLLSPDSTVSVLSGSEKKIVVMVTKEYHCLSDILVRHHFKTLGATVQHVIGNYPILEDLCRRFEVPFSHVPHRDLEKEIFEDKIMDILLWHKPDFIVLAKFMRILSPSFVSAFPARIINIHHSFLPAFAGANPYRQAFERGVKLIGATAHFVTDQLDQGPIIAQQVIPVTHSFTAADMVRAGQEIERFVLAKAFRLVFGERVFVHKNKTVVFD